MRGQEDPTPPTGEQSAGYAGDPPAGPTRQNVNFSAQNRVQDIGQHSTSLTA